MNRDASAISMAVVRAMAKVPMLRRIGGACALALTLAACAPAVRPPVFAPRERVPLAGLPTGMAGWPAPAWWHQYRDPQLDRLMALAMRDSPDLQVAQARYRQALAAVGAQRAERHPQVQGLVSASHGYVDPDLPDDVTQGLFQVGSSHSDSVIAGALASWDLDLWGKQRAAIAAAVGQARAAEAERAAAASSLQYAVAAAYVDWLGQQARLRIARQAERAAVDLRGLVALRVKAGLDDPGQLDQADDQLAQQRRNLAMCAGAAAQDKAQLAALAGTDPQRLDTLQARPLPSTDDRLPPDARLRLIARRPDIAAARWTIEASLRDIDQARAAYYPDVRLMALGAFLRSYPDLGSSSHTDLTLGNVGISMSLPIFSGGRLKAQFERSQAGLDTAVANYNRTIVQAAHDVAQQILTKQQLEAVQTQQQRSLQAQRAQLVQAENLRQEGIADDRATLRAQLATDRERDALVQLHARRLAADLSLIHALGGGYRAGELPPLPHVAAKDPQP
jgi:NodT family efflux transporter outer membrane factor (OMF) lipoprotein